MRYTQTPPAISELPRPAQGAWRCRSSRAAASKVWRLRSRDSACRTIQGALRMHRSRAVFDARARALEYEVATRAALVIQSWRFGNARERSRPLERLWVKQRWDSSMCVCIHAMDQISTSTCTILYLTPRCERFAAASIIGLAALSFCPAP